jgi:predicted DsbA family dithiol-disulfide isomerase
MPAARTLPTTAHPADGVANKVMRVEIWSDVVCPWCYVAMTRFDQALTAFPQRANVEVVHRLRG